MGIKCKILVTVVTLLTAPFISYYCSSVSMQSLSSSLYFSKPFTVLPRVKSQLTNNQKQSISVVEDSKSMAAKWAQKTVVIPPQRRGCHLVTSKILKEIEPDLSGFKCGLAHFFLQHTSASLTINENYDSDVQDDTETFLNRIVPEGRSAPWKHTIEGPDDMPAHIKSSMFGCALNIPITDGRLNMGTWQGIWLCEHRDHATPRKVVVTLNGI